MSEHTGSGLPADCPCPWVWHPDGAPWIYRPDPTCTHHGRGARSDQLATVIPLRGRPMNLSLLRLGPPQPPTYQERAREAAVAQARRWAARAREAEAAVERVTAWCDRLDQIARDHGSPDAVHPVAAHVRHHLTTAAEERPE